MGNNSVIILHFSAITVRLFNVEDAKELLRPAELPGLYLMVPDIVHGNVDPG